MLQHARNEDGSLKFRKEANQSGPRDQWEETRNVFRMRGYAEHEVVRRVRELIRQQEEYKRMEQEVLSQMAEEAKEMAQKVRETIRGIRK